MNRKVLLSILSLLAIISLSACSREQKGVDTVYNREKPTDFTREVVPPSAIKPPPPMLPGKAKIPGAPFQDYATQTGSAYTTAVKTQGKKTLPK